MTIGHRLKLTRQRIRSLPRQYRIHSWVLGRRRGLIAAVLLERQRAVAAHWDASPHPIWVRPGTSDIDTFKEVLLDGEYDFPLEKPPTTIIDVGANIGLTSIWLSTRYPNSRIVAVEAEQANYNMMVRNLKPFPNVIPVHAALWSHRGTLAINDPNGDGSWAFQTTELSEDGQGGKFGTVESLTINDLMERFDITRVNLLKIDIEGAEKEVFSARETAWIKSVDAITIELHDRLRAGCARAFFGCVGDEFPVEQVRGGSTFVTRGD